jgi:hypothetical protein
VISNSIHSAPSALAAGVGRWASRAQLILKLLSGRPSDQLGKHHDAISVQGVAGGDRAFPYDPSCR